MPHLAKIKLAGNEVLVELNNGTGGSDGRALPAPNGGGRVLDATESLNSAIRGYCLGLQRAFQAVDPRVRPNRVTVNFGLKLTGDLGFVLAKSGMEASLAVEAEWTFKE